MVLQLILLAIWDHEFSLGWLVMVKGCLGSSKTFRRVTVRVILNLFSYRNYNWFWVPIIGPHVGAVIGTLVYMLFVGIHWPTTFEARKHDAHQGHIDALDSEQKVRLTSVEAQKFVE